MVGGQGTKGSIAADSIQNMILSNNGSRDGTGLHNSGNLNSSIKKANAGGRDKSAGGVRTSTTNRSTTGGHIPGAENTKGSNSSNVIRKSAAGGIGPGGSSSNRKQGTNYINNARRDMQSSYAKKNATDDALADLED